jgi:hypothetical protein
VIQPAVIEKLKREKLEREYEERRIPLYLPIPRYEPPPNNGGPSPIRYAAALARGSRCNSES